MDPAQPEQGKLVAKIQDFLGLRRNVVVLSLAISIVGFGTQLWTSFLPKYLEALGASVFIIGIYGSLRNTLVTAYRYPAGIMVDKLGRRYSLVVFSILALGGYILYLLSPNWQWVLFGLLFVAVWDNLEPAVFATIGDSLPPNRRAIGFTVQSILRRVPLMLAPPIGGIIIVRFGLVDGVRGGLLITILVAIITTFVLYRYYVESRVKTEPKTGSLWRLLKEMDPNLKKLLVSDCLVRIGAGICQVFIVLYAINVVGIDSFQFGLLVSIQTLTSILVYIPVAKLSDRMSRKPFVALTFVFFCLFPLLLTISRSFGWLVLAFIIGGLREIGEPPRKALIVDLASPDARGREVGIYYAIRGLVVMPAPVIGGLLWQVTPVILFYTASSVIFAGLLQFIFWGPHSTGRVTSPPQDRL